MRSLSVAVYYGVANHYVECGGVAFVASTMMRQSNWIPTDDERVEIDRMLADAPVR